MLLSTLSTSALPFTIKYNLWATNIKLVNINKFAPSTAILFGVIPNSTKRNEIADKAIPFNTMVNTERPNKNNKLIFA